MTGPRIVLGVAGGIGAYKSAEVLRALQKAGADVTVAMTRHATEFISPLTMQTLSGRPVALDMYDLSRGADIEHIELVRKTDLLLVAPATANIIGKFASGVADDFLSTFYTAVKCPVLIAPAMNTRMWTSDATRANVQALASRGVAFVEPESGELACGEEGEGRLASPARIVQQALAHARRSRALRGLRAIVTAGPTREPIDPVRFVTNRSSGRMGYAIAAALARRGASVTLVSGPTSLPPPYGVERIDVETADEMAAEVLRRFPRCQALWMTAAVADFKPSRARREKISKRDGLPSIAWTRTPDILALVARKKKPAQIVVGFAAETHDLLKRAASKLREKNVDFIVANDVSKPGIGFDSVQNEVTLLGRGGKPERLPRASKVEIAERLLDRVHGAEAVPGRREAAKAGASDRSRSARRGPGARSARLRGTAR